MACDIKPPGARSSYSGCVEGDSRYQQGIYLGSWSSVVNIRNRRWSRFSRRLIRMIRSRSRRNHRSTAHIVIDTSLCQACWKCCDACPRKVLGRISFLWHRHVSVDNPELCLGCRKCIRACENGAIRDSADKNTKGKNGLSDTKKN
jgi:NAD-dependent dihydropyrimidine dehydrogenase PreA subunit